MARIVAIDYGIKRTGIAVTDPMQLIATPLQTVSTDTLLEFLERYTQQQDTEAFVVGMPRRLDGGLSPMYQRVCSFKARMQRVFPHHPIFEQDERYTSKIAQQNMRYANFSKRHRHSKAHVDVISATIILQFFLCQSKPGRPHPPHSPY